MKTKEQSSKPVDLLTPVVKAWGSDTSIDVASTGIQIHGGMGFIEETGAARTLQRCPNYRYLRRH